MYASFFGFEKVPFNGIPDSDEMVAHRSFERAHATLRNGVLQGASVLLLAGEPGAGKTTLLHKLRASLEADGFQVHLLSACVDAAKLAELGAGALRPLGGTSVPGTADARDRSDGSGTSARPSLVILADDAHLLSKDKLRFFSDLITRVAASHAPVQIVFVGDSSLNAVLTRHGVDAIARSVQVRAVLAPLERDEIAQYVSAKLQVAGGHPHSLLDDQVVVELARRSAGNPSRIDTLCGMVLLIAYDSGKKLVEPAMVAEAVRDLDGDAGERLESLATCANPTAAGEEAPGPVPQITTRASIAGWRPAVDRALGSVWRLAPAAAGTAGRALRRSGQSIRDIWRGRRRLRGARGRHHPEPGQTSAVAAVLRTYERDWLPLKIGFVGLLFVVVVVIAIGVAQDRTPVVTAMAPPSPSLPDPSSPAAPSPPSSASFATEMHTLEQALAASKAEALAKERVLTKQQAQIEELQQQTADLEARLATARAVAPTRLALPGNTSPVAAFPADAEAGPGPMQDEDDRIASLPDVTADASLRTEGGAATAMSSPTGGGPVLVSTRQGDDPTDRAGSQAVPPGAAIPLPASVADQPDDPETELPAVEDRSNPSDGDVAGAADVLDATVVDSSVVDAVLPEPSRLRQPGEKGRTVAADAGQAKPAGPRGRTVKPVDARAADAERHRVMTGDTPYAAVSARLLDAAERGERRLVQDLLGAGASVNVRDEEGRTPLMLAAGRGHLEVARILLDRGAAIGAANTSLGTALAYAAWSGHAEVVSELLSRGSQNDSTNGEGWTPLMYAAINGHIQCVNELLDHGANVNARNREGRTALSAAVWNGHTRLAHALLGRGADVNAKTRDGWTPLLDAAFNGDSVMVGLLLDRGADRSAQTRTGMTAVAIARERGHDDIAETLSRPRTARQAS